MDRPVSEGATGEPVHHFEPLDWAIVRCPALPAACVQDDLGLADAPSEAFLAALQVASPSLFSKIAGTGDRSPSVVRKARRYARRMATRATPFGLFSGVGLIGWGERTDLRLGSEPVQRRLTLSSELLDRLRRDCERSPGVLRGLRVWPNPMVYEVSDRFWVWAGPNQEFGEFSIRRIPLTVEIFAQSRNGPNILDLFAQLGERFPTLTEDRFLKAVAELLKQSFLISDLYPKAASIAAEEEFCSRLAQIPAAQQLSAAIQSVRQAMRDLERPGHAAGEDLARAHRRASDLAPGFSEAPLKVDGVLNLSAARVSRKVAEEAAALATLLCRLNPVPQRPPWYDQVKARFLNRYGVHRDVPVDTVVRQNPLLDFVPKNEMTFNRRDIAVLKIAAQSLGKGLRVLELDEALITELAATVEGTPSFPTSCEIAVTVCATTASELDRGEFRLLLSPLVGTRQAGRMSGRFLVLLDGENSPRLEAICRKEEAALAGRGRIRAEVFYTPKRAKVQNVMGHPEGWAHAVVLNANPNIRGKRIELEDLRVGVRDGELAIVWTKTGQVVEVSALQMLSFVEGARLVRFLTEVGGWQSAVVSGFDWGLAGTFPRLPRVVAGKSILRPAQWRLERSLAPTREAFATWRADFDVPERAYLVIKDNRLWLDFEDPEHVDELLAELAALDSGAALYLEECIPGMSEAWVEGNDGLYLAEMTIPLGSGSLAVAASPSLSPLDDYDDRDRNKSLASEWVYVSLYADWHLQDWIISGKFAELLAGVEIQKFFYIRYSDPLPHLRLRVARGDNSDDRVVTRLAAWADGLLREGLCADFAFLRYEREFERYGGVRGMRLAEDIFVADSLRCQAMIAACIGKRGSLDPRSLCVFSLDRLLKTFGMDDGAIANSFEETPAQKRALGPEFRRLKDELRAILSSGVGVSAEMKAAVEAADLAFLAAWEELERLAAEGTLATDLGQLRRSFAHLHVNRLLGVDPQTEEEVFALLARARTSLLVHPQS